MLDQALKNMRHLSSKSSHPIVETTTQVNVDNYLNLQYTGPVYMGSGLEKIDVIYDTGSHWLAIDTDLCANCTALDGTYFNTAASTTFNVFDSDTGTTGI